MPDDAVLDQAAEALAAGEPVVLPTDTVYGIAVVAEDRAATARLFEIKQRPAAAALPVLAADADQAFGLCGDVPDLARRLAELHWPGGLTLVLPRRPGLDLDLGGVDDGTIGVRVPDHPVPTALAGRVGPLAATSANRHGRPTPATAPEVAEELGGSVRVVVDGGTCAGDPSTVVAVSARGDLTVLREGRIPADRL
jgi:L-threonylcarbamoyladenylate synthase